MGYVIAIHDISDPDRFWSAVDPAAIPAGVKLHSVYPRGDGSRAVCVWEADSVDSVRDVVDGATGDVSRNEFYEVDAQHAGATGLPASAAGSV